MLNRKIGVLVLLLGLILTEGCAVGPAVNRPVVHQLRCEYREAPIGIDVAQPRLSWVLESVRRGARQTAYQVLVASTWELLARNRGDLWDSGKVASGQSNQVAYAGQALETRERCHWKVRVWDESGIASPWSTPEMWSMGLLQPTDWTAQWIGYDSALEQIAAQQEAKKTFSTHGLKWVRFPKKMAPQETSRAAFRKIIVVPEGRKVRVAMFVLYADNVGKVFVNDTMAGESLRWERTARIDVTRWLRPGENVLGVEVENSDNLPAAAIGKLVVQFESGMDLQVWLDANWKVSQRPEHGWQGAGYVDRAWPAAEVMKGTPWGTPALNDVPRVPVPYLRKAFMLAKPVRHATMSATALGMYALHLNGQKVGSDELTPGWPDFRRRIYYQTYDVTRLLRNGDNALGALLSDGWYAGTIGFTGRRGYYGNAPRLRVQLDIEFIDGSHERVISDASWKAAYGALRAADLLLGCEYDGRQELAGWDKTGFDDGDWAPVRIESANVSQTVQAAVAEPSRRFEELPAVSVSEPRTGQYTYDLGQNMVGWVRLKLRGRAGQRITVRHGEMLNPDGTVYCANLRGANATDFFTLAGTGEEVLEPTFTLHGFRYVELRGLETKPELSAVTGIVVHSALERTGQFACSSQLVNQLYHNIIWGQKGNYVEVPTDCPQRDERLGWTGDTQFFIPTAAYNFDVAPFFTRWLTAMCEDGQRPDGSLPVVAPDIEKVGVAATAWSDAGIICAHHVYRTYGDTRVIAEHYEAMDRYMQYLASRTSGELITRLPTEYLDWVNLGGSAPAEVISAAYYGYVAGLMAEMARAIGREADAARYSALHEQVRHKFGNWFKADGTLTSSSQTGYALAFTMDYVPEGLREKAAAKFAEEIAKFNGHLATGFIGTPRLLPGLHAAGRDDLANALLLQESYPSWLFQVKLGATTMWERWDGWTPERGFQTIGMNSFNHYAFGAVGEYLYGSVAGIRAESPGYKTIRIQPSVGHGLTWARARYDCMFGTIECGWRLENGGLTMDVRIPANTTARAYVPAKQNAVVTESGVPVSQARGVKQLGREGEAAVFEIDSGTYQFKVE